MMAYAVAILIVKIGFVPTFSLSCRYAIKVLELISLMSSSPEKMMLTYVGSELLCFVLALVSILSKGLH